MARVRLFHQNATMRRLFLSFLLVPWLTVACVDRWAQWIQDDLSRPEGQSGELAESSPSNDPQSLELGPSFLATYETTVERAMGRFEVPGAAVAVVGPHRIHYSRGFGDRHLHRNRPVTEETLFRIGSGSRVLTATMLGVLVDEQLLDWSGRLTWHDHKIDTSVHELLCLADRPADDMLAPLGTYLLGSRPIEDLEPPSTPIPDSTASGSPPSLIRNADRFAVATYAALRKAGDDRNPAMAFRRRIHAKLFGPAGMTRTTIGGDLSTIDDDYARPYALGLDGSIAEIEPSASDAYAPFEGVASTVTDMARFVSVHMGAGISPSRQRVVSPANLERSRRLSATVSPERSSCRALFDVPCRRELGWTVHQMADGDELWTVEGGLPGYAMTMAFLARRQVGLVILSNKDPRSGGAAFVSHGLNAFFSSLLELPGPGETRPRDEDLRYSAFLDEVHSLKAAAVTPSSSAARELLGVYAGGWSLERDGRKLWLRKGLTEFPVASYEEGLRLTAGPALGLWLGLAEAPSAARFMTFTTTDGLELARLEQLGRRGS